MTLSMAGLGIMSNCDCSQSSFNPALISPLISYSISASPNDAPITIKVMLDTVSSVCGLADGFSYCPHSSVIFKDKSSGLQVTFPNNGFSWNAATSELTVNPAFVFKPCVLTVTVSLVSNPSVNYNQEITWTIITPKLESTPKFESTPQLQPLRIPDQKLNVKIGQEAVIILPGDIGASFTIVNNP